MNQDKKQSKKEDNYSKIPNKLWSMPISVRSKAIWGYIKAQKPGFNPSISYIAKMFDTQRRTISHAIQELVAQKMIIYNDAVIGYKGKIKTIPVSDWLLIPKDTPLKIDHPLSQNTPPLKIDHPLIENDSTPESKTPNPLIKKRPSNKTNITKLNNKTKYNKTNIPPTSLGDKKSKKKISSKYPVEEIDLKAAEIWGSYIYEHHSKRRKIILNDEAAAFAELRLEFSWDLPFLQSLTKFLIKTKMPDKDDFSYFPYAIHLKWFLKLTSDRSQRKAEMIIGQVEYWEQKEQKEKEEKIFWDPMQFVSKEMHNVTPIIRRLEEKK